MALFGRIWLAATLVNFAVLTVFVVLAIVQFGSINANLVSERLTVLAGHTAAPFEAAARIGLPLSTVRNADALLERARQTDDSILAIHVFDGTGRIIRSTMETAPAAISAETQVARAAANGAPWHVETPDGFISGIEIRSRDRSPVGGIMIAYPARGSVTRVRAMAAELGLAAMAVLLVAAVLGALLLRIGLARQIRMFEEIDGTISAFERESWRSAAGAEPVEAAHKGKDRGLRSLLEVAETRYRAVGHMLAKRAGERQ